MGNSSSDSTRLLVRKLSCFCLSCMEKDWENCEQKAHVQVWRAVKMQPKSIDREPEDPEEPDQFEYASVTQQ